MINHMKFRDNVYKGNFNIAPYLLMIKDLITSSELNYVARDLTLCEFCNKGKALSGIRSRILNIVMNRIDEIL